VNLQAAKAQDHGDHGMIQPLTPPWRQDTQQFSQLTHHVVPYVQHWKFSGHATSENTAHADGIATSTYLRTQATGANQLSHNKPLPLPDRATTQNAALQNSVDGDAVMTTSLHCTAAHLEHRVSLQLGGVAPTR
jgi:hypothetical protein